MGFSSTDPGAEDTHPTGTTSSSRVWEVLDLLCGDRAEAIEQEACEILGVRELREYFQPAGRLL